MNLTDQSAFFWPWHGLTPFPFPVRRGLAAQSVDGAAHLLIGSAAADVARKRFLNFLGSGFWVFVQRRPHGNHETRRAEAALLRVVGNERRRHIVQLGAGN